MWVKLRFFPDGPELHVAVLGDGQTFIRASDLGRILGYVDIYRFTRRVTSRNLVSMLPGKSSYSNKLLVLTFEEVLKWIQTKRRKHRRLQHGTWQLMCKQWYHSGRVKDKYPSSPPLSVNHAFPLDLKMKGGIPLQDWFQQYAVRVNHLFSAIKPVHVVNRVIPFTYSMARRSVLCVQLDRDDLSSSSTRVPVDVPSSLPPVIVEYLPSSSTRAPVDDVPSSSTRVPVDDVPSSLPPVIVEYLPSSSTRVPVDDVPSSSTRVPVDDVPMKDLLSTMNDLLSYLSHEPVDDLLSSLSRASVNDLLSSLPVEYLPSSLSCASVGDSLSSSAPVSTDPLPLPSKRVRRDVLLPSSAPVSTAPLPLPSNSKRVRRDVLLPSSAPVSTDPLPLPSKRVRRDVLLPSSAPVSTSPLPLPSKYVRKDVLLSSSAPVSTDPLPLPPSHVPIDELLSSIDDLISCFSHK